MSVSSNIVLFCVVLFVKFCLDLPMPTASKSGLFVSFLKCALGKGASILPINLFLVIIINFVGLSPWLNVSRMDMKVSVWSPFQKGKKVCVCVCMRTCMCAWTRQVICITQNQNTPRTQAIETASKDCKFSVISTCTECQILSAIDSEIQTSHCWPMDTIAVNQCIFYCY